NENLALREEVDRSSMFEEIVGSSQELLRVLSDVGRVAPTDSTVLILGETGELPAEIQVSLLRVLQEREFERLGSNQPIAIDVRILAATNRNLKAAVTAGT